MLVPSIFENNFVDDIFNDVFSVPFGFSKAGVKAPVSSMNADVQEFEDKYKLDLELPGYKKEDIQAKFENGILEVIIPKKEAKPEVEEHKYISITG